MNTMMMDPWNVLDDLFGTSSRMFRSMRARAAGHYPPVNVYLDADAARIELELPGRSAKDVDLSVEPQAVIVADKPTESAAQEGQTAVKRAPAWSRRIELPFRIAVAKAGAKFANGILMIELPKAEANDVRKIVIG